MSGDHARGGPRGHGHGHGGLATRADAAGRRHLLGALALIVALMAGEVAVGLVAHSLALITDAAHMLTDAVAIGLALFAMRLAAKPPEGGYTYGRRRAEILSAQGNGVLLLGLACFFVFEAVRRLAAPPEVSGPLVFATALAGIVVNLAATVLVGRADRASLNIEGAFQHILNDLYAFIATAVAGLVVWTSGFARADAIASLIVAALMVKAGYGLVRDAWRIIMEAAPQGIDPAEVGERLAAQPCVVEVHDLHVWEVTSGYVAASAHVLVEPGGDCHAVRKNLGEVLRAEYAITHATLEVDHAADDAASDAADHCADAHGPSHRVPGDAEPHVHLGEPHCGG
ncbi:MAG TPA: cation diffusion facilitator family transporter [Streptosporangiaceae bacterium]